MKTNFIQLITVFLMTTGICFGQDILQDQVPSVVINSFKEAFPKASDVEWEHINDLYKAEFEIGFFSEHEARLDSSGKLLRHTEDISKKDLPKTVSNVLKTDFDSYNVDDIDKITEEKKVTYKIELEKYREEKTVIFAQDGTLIN